MNDFFLSGDAPRERPLSLHHLCALEVTPTELISLAAEAGCDHVCLFTHVPEAARHVYPMVRPADVAALGAHMAASGVSLLNLEVFPLDGTEDEARFDAALATGAALGARRATAHVHAADRATAIARFGRFCDLAARHGIVAGLEFNAFSAVRDIGSAAAVVRAAARANGGLVCDMLHLVRSGGTPDDVAAAADLIGYAQICDGPATIAEADRWHEAIRERMLPGSGDFPIVEALRHLAGDAVIEIEVPQTAARKAGTSARERVTRAVAATRAVLRQVDSEERPA